MSTDWTGSDGDIAPAGASGLMPPRYTCGLCGSPVNLAKMGWMHPDNSDRWRYPVCHKCVTMWVQIRESDPIDSQRNATPKKRLYRHDMDKNKWY